MADLLNLIPGLSNLSNILGGSGQNKGMFQDPANNRLSIAGVPIAPILGGLATGAIARSLVPRRNRAAAMGTGFSFGHRLFDDPIQQERGMRNALLEAALNKGWVTPFGSEAPTATTDRTSPTSSAVQAPVIDVGGTRLFMAPTMKAGEMFPGRNLPPSLANAPVVIGSDPARIAEMQTAAESSQELGKLDSYIKMQTAKHGLPTDLPRGIAMQEIGTARVPEMIQRYRGAVGPIDDNTGVSFEFGPDGRPQMKLFTAPTALTGLQKSQLEGEVKAQESLHAFRQKQLEAAKEERAAMVEQRKAEARIAELRAKAEEAQAEREKARLEAYKDPNSLESRELRLRGAQNEMTGLTAQLEVMRGNRSPLVPPTAQELANEAAIQKRLFEISNEMRAISTGGQAQGPPPPIDPGQVEQAEKIDIYEQRLLSQPSWKNIDKLPRPKNLLEQEAFDIAKQKVTEQISEIVSAIDESANRESWFGPWIPSDTEAYLRSQYGDDNYKKALEVWKARGRK